MTDAAGRPIQAVAWLVLLGAFTVFLAGALGVPWLGVRYWRQATVPEPATVECKTGSCALSIRGAPAVAHRAESGETGVPEGTVYTTDGRSKGFVRVFDGASVHLEANTAIALERMRRPRFRGSESEPRVALRVLEPRQGTTSRLSLGTTWADTDVIVDTPMGRVFVQPETRVRLDLAREHLRLTVSEGTALVESGGRSVAVRADELVDVAPDTGPGVPRNALENILADGDFDVPLQRSDWRVRVDYPGDSEGVVRPTAAIERINGDAAQAVRIVREDSNSTPADLIFEQLLDRDLSNATKMSVWARLRINDQSLPLGGTRGTEFPVILKLVAESESGAQLDWKVGFYAVPAPEDEPRNKYVAHPTDRQVPLGEWVTFDSGNLLDDSTPYSLARFHWPEPPARLLRFEIIASGHDYSADVDQVELWVK